jgi:hypothetical protein
MKKKILLILTLILYQNMWGQVLHHQMISAQGGTHKLPNGMMVTQTVGQQSPIGNSNNDFYMGQGFQQSVWIDLIESNIKVAVSTSVYPNPFVSNVSFQFSSAVGPQIRVSVFNVAGIVVYDQESTVENDLLTINLSHLPSSAYLIRLTARGFSYFTKIIKKT